MCASRNSRTASATEPKSLTASRSARRARPVRGRSSDCAASGGTRLARRARASRRCAWPGRRSATRRRGARRRRSASPSSHRPARRSRGPAQRSGSKPRRCAPGTARRPARGSRLSAEVEPPDAGHEVRRPRQPVEDDGEPLLHIEVRSRRLRAHVQHTLPHLVVTVDTPAPAAL